MGFHSFWTVEHHFLEEYSHCSNPEVLYGAIAARTDHDAPRVRRAPAAEAVQPPDPHRRSRSAVLDLISDGRVEFGTGRSSTRAELEGFDIDPHGHARDVAGGARAHRGRVDEREYQADGKYWRMGAPRRVQPEAAAEAAPADLSGATSSADGPPRDRAPRHRAVLVHRRRAARGARRAASRCTARASTSARSRSAKFVNDRAATFTMVHCARHQRGGVRGRRRIRSSGTSRPPCASSASLADWQAGEATSAPTSYAEHMAQLDKDGSLDHLDDRLPARLRVGGDRRPGPVHRVGEALRGLRLRPAAVPREPVQDPAREGDAVDRAPRRARHPAVRVAGS